MAHLPIPVAVGRYVFHIDVNSAFLSWSAAYRVDVLGEKEDIRQIPSIVGGDQEKRHGIVLAKSTPAKKFGIQTGEPIVAAKKKCPGLVIVPPDYGLYVTSSRAFIKILQEYSDQVIQYSIDEAWVVFEGFEKLYGRDQMVTLAYELKDRIREELGFTVNVGISENFLLSKTAGDFRSRIKYTRFLQMKSHRRCGRFLFRICSFAAGPRWRSCTDWGFVP